VKEQVSDRGGNPDVFKAVSEKQAQHMAWAYERPEGGRGLREGAWAPFTGHVLNDHDAALDIDPIDVRPRPLAGCERAQEEEAGGGVHQPRTLLGLGGLNDDGMRAARDTVHGRAHDVGGGVDGRVAVERDAITAPVLDRAGGCGKEGGSVGVDQWRRGVGHRSQYTGSAATGGTLRRRRYGRRPHPPLS